VVWCGSMIPRNYGFNPGRGGRFKKNPGLGDKKKKLNLGTSQKSLGGTNAKTQKEGN